LNGVIDLLDCQKFFRLCLLDFLGFGRNLLGLSQRFKGLTRCYILFLFLHLTNRLWDFRWFLILFGKAGDRPWVFQGEPQKAFDFIDDSVLFFLLGITGGDRFFGLG